MAKIPVTWNGVDAQGQPLRWDTPGLTWDGFVPQPTNKKMPQLRVLLGFNRAVDHAIEELATAVLGKMYPNTALPAPTVSQAALTTARDEFSSAIATAKNGGPEDTAIKNNKKETLVGLLRVLAGYVQQNHGNDLAVLLSSGFEAVSTNRASTPLEVPVIREIVNRNSGELVVRCAAVPNAKCYECRYALVGANGAPGEWVSAGLFTNSRGMTFTGLTPGAMYICSVRAIGGSTGHTDWSDSVSHRSL